MNFDGMIPHHATAAIIVPHYTNLLTHSDVVAIIENITAAIQHFSTRQIERDRERMDEVFRYLLDQRRFSFETFGDGMRTKQICAHIRKELAEIESAPTDLTEWVDVIILAMDGYWRAGGKPNDLMAMIRAKLEVNKRRTWPPVTDGDEAVEHIREGR